MRRARLIDFLNESLGRLAAEDRAIGVRELAIVLAGVIQDPILGDWRVVHVLRDACG